MQVVISGKFISVLLTSLTSMLQVELPLVNVLSKVDLAEQYGKLHFGLDFYTEVLDLDYLLQSINKDPFMKKYRKFNSSLVEVIENYSLVSFIPLCVSKVETIKNVRAAVDKANGYIFGSDEERSMLNLLSSVIGAQPQSDFSGNLTEKFLDQDVPDEDIDIE